jgi:acyl-CoA thioester hydrolase
MKEYSLPIQVRWSDIDQNRHLRHSAYYDYGALVRFSCFSVQGLSNQRLEEMHIGPILFREEAVFKREIKFEDQVTVNLEVTKSTPDFSRWSIRHHFFKQDGVLSALLNMDGAWIDVGKRKLTIPNFEIQRIFNEFPKSDDFQWVNRTPKSPSAQS